jgi:hypothetical protein
MKINILDTGWYSRDRDGTQAAVANRAGYDGTSAVTTFTINTKAITLTKGSSIDDKPVPSSSSFTELNQVTAENPSYSIKMIISKDDATADFNNSMFFQLMRLDSTDGIKLVYPSDETDDDKSVVELMGAANIAGNFQGAGKELSASTPYLQGRFKKISVVDDGKMSYHTITLLFQEE